MQALFTNRKDLFSTWLLIIFLSALMLTVTYTKYFHIPGARDHNLERIRILFDSSDLKNIKSMELKNKLGQFKMEQFASDKNQGQWLLTSPRRLYANHRIINQILKVLEDIRIKKVYPKDQINLANFSLLTPNVELSLIDQTGGTLKISVGLINPIDNSTYLLSSDSDAIFHIQALPSFIEKLNFSDFVDSQLANIDFASVDSMKIMKRDVPKAQLLLLTDKNDEWKASEGRLLDKASVQNYFNELTSKQSYLILDATSTEQKEAIDKLMEKPLYQFSVKLKTGKRIVFKISPLIHSIPNIKIEKRKYVLIQSSEKDHSLVYDKEILKSFYKTQFSYKRRKK